MDTLQIRDAKAGLSAIVKAAEQGHPTLITRHGHPAAMVVPFEVGERLYPLATASLASHLLAFPSGLEIERDLTPLRDAGL